MNLTSLKVSQELYELSGWELDKDDRYLGKWWWSLNGVTQDWAADRYKLTPEQVVAPAYDLAYLLLRLPPSIFEGDNWIQLDNALDKELWTARYTDGLDFGYDERLVKLSGCAESPADSVAMLAIELYKQGILK